MKNFKTKIVIFLKRNINKIEKWSQITLNILMSINLILILFSIWNVNYYKSANPTNFMILVGLQIFTSFFIIVSLYYNWKNKNDQNKLNRNILIMTSFIVIFAIPVTYFLLHIGRTLSINEGFKIGTADGWLSFIGSIIGGIITMLAVVYTIQNERLINSKKSLPYFNLKISNDAKLKVAILDSSNFDAREFIEIYITNTSQFNAVDFKFINIDFNPIGPVSNKEIIEGYKELVEEEFYSNVFYSNESRILYLPIFENLYKHTLYNLNIDFEYYDFLKVKKYVVSTLITLDISTSVDIKNNLQNYIGKEIYFDLNIEGISYKYINL